MWISVLRLLDGVSRGLSKVIERLLGVALIAIFSIIVAEVLGRGYLGFTLPWMPEAVGFLLAFITFAGMSCHVQRRKLLALTFVKEKVFHSDRMAVAFDIAVWVILLFYTIVLVVVGLEFAERGLGRYTTSRVFHIYHARLIVPLGGGLILLQGVINLITDVDRLFAGDQRRKKIYGQSAGAEVAPKGDELL